MPSPTCFRGAGADLNVWCCSAGLQPGISTRGVCRSRPGGIGATKRPSGFAALFRGLPDGHDGIEKMALRQRAFKCFTLVDHGLGDSVDAVLRGQIGKLCGLDAVGRDVRVFNCKLLCQAYRPRAVRSSGRDKDFQMDRLAELSKPCFALRAQAGIAS